jgi:DNA-binding transcriptional MerR regulator
VPLSLSIGQLAEQTHCKVPTIRYYEEIGLLPPPERTAGNQRRYAAQHLSRLKFIQHCRGLGFRQNAIRDLLTLSATPGMDCEAVADVARGHLTEIQERIDRLLSMKAELQRMIDGCEGGEISDCRIIEALTDSENA